MSLNMRFGIQSFEMVQKMVTNISKETYHDRFQYNFAHLLHSKRGLANNFM